MHCDHTVHFKRGFRFTVGQSNVLGNLTPKHVHIISAVFFQFHVDVQTRSTRNQLILINKYGSA